MKEIFYVYLNNLYWLYEEYGIQKDIYIDPSSYNCDSLCICNYYDRLFVSSLNEYIMEKRRAYTCLLRNDGEYELPSIKYQTNDISEINSILNTLKISDYETKIKELMNIMKDEKTLTLVDNKG